MVIIGNYAHSIYTYFTENHEIISHIMSYLLSEYRLYKESIEIIKNFDSEILTLSMFLES